MDDSAAGAPAPIADAPEAPDAADLDVETSAGAAERLTFFTDAVIAIAMTLLALELPVPTGSTNADLLHYVGRHYEDYVAFLVSFVVIGAHWRAHHRMFRYLGRSNPWLTSLNLYWLLLQVITSFATRVLTGDGGFQVRFGFYALVQGTADVIFVIIIQVIRVKGLARPGTRPRYAEATLRASAIAAAFLVSVPLSVLGRWAYLCWIASPLLTNVARRLYGRRAGLRQATDEVTRP
jgi:uncharacterized membrane protein